MHIVYLHQYFATPLGSTGTRSYEFARRWIRAGHKVTLITGNYDIGGLTVRKGLIQTQCIEGIEIIIVGTRYGNKQSFARRILSFICFIVLSIYAGLKVKEIDVMYVTSTPLTVGIPAMVLKWLKRVPFVFEVRDQWPAVPIGMGIIKNKMVRKILLWLEKTIYKQSAAVVALSPGMAEGVRNVIGNDRPVVMIPNSSDTGLFSPDVDGSEVRKQWGWSDKLVLLHAGAIGMANGLDFVVDVAERLKDRSDIHFVLAGKGSRERLIAERVRKLGLRNFEMAGSIPKTEVARFLAACDVSMVIFADYPILEHNSANKFFDSLGAGKPVLLNYSGWQREMIEDYGAGLGCEQCNIDEFADKILYLNSHRDELAEMGRKSRLLAEERFDRDELAGKVLEVITSL